MKRTLIEGAKSFLKYEIGDIGLLDRTFHTRYEIFLLTKGNAELVYDHGTRLVKQNEMIIIPPRKYHQFFIKGNAEEYERCVIEFPVDFLEKLNLKDFVFDEIVSFRKNEYINKCILNSIEIAKNLSEDNIDKFLMCIINEIYILIKNFKLNNEEQPVDYSNVFDAAIKYINDNIYKKITINDIAEYCYISPSTLSHNFKKRYKISLIKYVENRKMIEARRYLKANYMPTEVSKMLGYSDYSTFYKAYIRNFKITPKNEIRS